MTLEADYDKPYGITLNLNRDFVNALRWNRRKYGETFEKINGLHNSNLNFTDFIDNFEKEKTVGDATIDSNANVNTHDVVSLMHEMVKPHQKLLSLNKIYIEMEKKYGKEEANRWFENEYSGSFYLHDASSTALLPYCIPGTEISTFIMDGKKISASMEDIYSMIKSPEKTSENGVAYKEPVNLMVLDYDVEQECGKYTRVFVISKKDTEENIYFTKAKNGCNLLTTETHQFITDKGEMEARNLEEHGDMLHSVFDEDAFTNSIVEYNGLKLTKELGWIIGMYLAEGYEQRGQLSICQSYEKSKDTYERIIKTLDNLGIPHHEYANANDKWGALSNVIRLKNGEFKWERKMRATWRGKYCNEKRLCSDYIHFNDDFLKGILAGIIDGDGTVSIGKQLMIRMTSRTLINQIRDIGLHFGVFFGSRLPYIQSANAKIRQTKPMYSANINMNRNREFFLTLGSTKIDNGFTDFDYDEKFATKDYIPEMGDTLVRDVKQTYKPSKTVYDLTTESHTFVCNNLHIHNCYSYDLQRLADDGLYFIAQFKTGPAKHLDTFVHHVQEFVSWASNRTSGACGLATFLFHSYGFWLRDVENGYYTKDPETYRRQAFQEFIYNLNQPYLRVVQSAFTNISIFDREYLTEVFGARQLPNGDYGIDHIEDLIEHQKVFMEVVSDIRSKNMMTFPVLSYNLLYKDGKFVDEEFARWCSDHNSKWYDSNFMNASDVGTFSNCCRLLSDSTKLTGFINSIGGTALSIGSVKVNTINMRRISLESMDETGKPNQEEFFRILRRRTRRCCEVLDVIRGIIRRNVEKGFLPNYTYGLIEFDKQYCTIGVTAIYEVVKDFGLIRTDEFGYNYYTDEGIALVKRIFDTINEVKDTMDVDFTYNIENVPGESANKKLYQKDFLLFGEKKAGNRTLYANQWIALTDKCTIDEKIRTAAILDPLCSGGQIAHINLESPISPEQHWFLLNKIAKAGCQYFAFNPKISVCAAGHGFFGETCPECGGPKTDTFSRIVGYLVPTSNFERSRKVEFNERQWFDLSEKM